MKASAYIVGPRDGPGLALAGLAGKLGYEPVAFYGGVTRAEKQAQQTPTCFFFFAAVDDPKTLSPVARAIRFSSSRRLRFSPLIYFADSPSRETIEACIEMGFDDVIALPFDTERVAARLARQIDTPLVYFEASGYFGPDRRGRIADLSTEPRVNAKAGGPYRRLEILRTLGYGVTVLRDEWRPAA